MSGLFGWWTRGVAAVATPASPAPGPQWVQTMGSRPKEVYLPRARPNNEVWVLPGDIRSSRMTEDTWEGEAT